MIHALLLSIILATSTFYVSSSQGNDQYSGTSPDQAWQSLSRVTSQALIPGDSVLFHAGDEFIGQLIINNSGVQEAPIVFGRYGDGEKPVINSAPSPGGSFESSILIRNQSFIELRDLEVTNNRLVPRIGQDDQKGYGIFVHNNGNEIMQHFRFRNLMVREVFAITTEGVDFNSLQVAGIYFRSERNTVAGQEKHIRDILVEGSFITLTGKFGIWSQHGGGAAGVGNDSINRNMNLVFRNNHTYKTGGSGITPGRSYNCLLEGNTFEYPGSDTDPRMAKRGSGAWFFAGRNIVAQFNRTLHARGPGDTYGIHIDHGNRNVLVQYNYTEDSEGGFVEILGNNVNSIYRYNISVNDGIRHNARSIWISDYAGGTRRIRSDSNYVYNNTIFVGNGRSPGIHMNGHNTFVYNNIFYTEDNGSIGEDEMVIDISPGSSLHVSNNLFHGNINASFFSLDSNRILSNPLFLEAGGSNAESYQLEPGSPAINAGKSFEHPPFPNAGKGIFSGIPKLPEQDMFGNPVNSSPDSISIGAYVGKLQETSVDVHPERTGSIILKQNYPNPFNPATVITFTLEVKSRVTLSIYNAAGQMVAILADGFLDAGRHIYPFDASHLSSGIYVYRLEADGRHYSRLMTIIK